MKRIILPFALIAGIPLAGLALALALRSRTFPAPPPPRAVEDPKPRPKPPEPAIVKSPEPEMKSEPEDSPKPPPIPKETFLINYNIIAERDVSYALCKRINMRVELVSIPDIKLIVPLARLLCQNKRVDEFTVWYYSPKTDFKGVYSAGFVELNKGVAVDVKYQGVHGDKKPKPHTAGIPEERRRKIYWEVTERENMDEDCYNAAEILANKYGLSQKVVSEIIFEGLLSYWPCHHKK